MLWVCVFKDGFGGIERFLFFEGSFVCADGCCYTNFFHRVFHFWKARCSSVVLPRSACLQSSSCGFRCVRFPQSQIHLLKARRRPALACAARTGRRRQGSSSSKIKVGNIFTSLFFFCSLSLSSFAEVHAFSDSERRICNITRGRRRRRRNDQLLLCLAEKEDRRG